MEQGIPVMYRCNIRVRERGGLKNFIFQLSVQVDSELFLCAFIY